VVGGRPLCAAPPAATVGYPVCWVFSGRIISTRRALSRPSLSSCGPVRNRVFPSPMAYRMRQGQ
jgi:hypothetical protein